MKNRLDFITRKVFKTFIVSAVVVTAYEVTAQRQAFSTIDSINAKSINWHNLDLKSNKTAGASVEKAYTNQLTGLKTSKNIVVAVIDAGVDIYHEDLQGKIWVNKNEIPNNGIDDDNNGYIDDVNGWNFLGNAKGENIEFETLEYTRLLRQLQPMFKDVDESQIPEQMKDNYILYQKCKTEYDDEFQKYQNQRKNIESFEKNLEAANGIISQFLGKEDFTINEVKRIKSKDKMVSSAKNFLVVINKRGFTPNSLKEAKDHISLYLDKHLNLDYEPRTIIGDDIANIADRYYGNNNVKGPDSFHGTFVAGIIAANRSNNLGIDGIAENVQIMPIRAVPQGDEMDKDIALAIYYAVDNGANIINMSFGKAFSPQKNLVDQAMQYAESKGVLLIHSAGNDAKDLDVKESYPSNATLDGKIIANWLTVGASSNKLNDKLCGVFSNYGQQNVDLFAPGVDVVSLTTENRYMTASGTSFSGPVVTGVAALVWSNYPHLTAAQVKEILMKSVTGIPNQKVLKPSDDRSAKAEKVTFGKLSKTGGLVNAYEALKMAATY
jgi:subtilisin family serine protease